eukprot:TRINITY_DN10679_c0_g1_i1.p1 TRINITY_DN10679_c0_g1~~TRINITY_DN10679_c0_g1_i1.p1  ORF type:complete len:572 (+),score=106.23 TRINITY_DN10679_c0_g1_i1:107-1822(+)
MLAVSTCQDSVEVLDREGRVLSTVPFGPLGPPSLSAISSALPDHYRQSLRHSRAPFRHDRGVIACERQWQDIAAATPAGAADEGAPRVLRLTLRLDAAGGSIERRGVGGATEQNDLGGPPSGSLFAISGPVGDRVYAARRDFDQRLEHLLEHDNWDDILVLPPAFADDYRQMLCDRGVPVLMTSGAMALQKGWHGYAASGAGVAGFVGGSFVVGRRVRRWLPQMSRVANGFGSFVVGCATFMVARKTMRFFLPRFTMKHYSVAMRRDGEKLQVLTVADGRARREALFSGEVQEQLDEIVGQKEVKRQVERFAMSLYCGAQRSDEASSSSSLRFPRQNGPSAVPHHMLLAGNPGTGKTAIARLLASVLCAVGVTRTDKLVEVQREELVGEHVGATCRKTRNKVKEARGGVLFVDEAYRLVKRGEHDFGQEALEEVMRFMEDGDPLVIFAGYPAQMNTFIEANPGLRRRVRHVFFMRDYTCTELAEIFVGKARKNNVALDDASVSDIANLLEAYTAATWRRKHNGGAADRLLSLCKETLSDRLFQAQWGGVVPHRDVSTLTLEEILTAVLRLS